MIKATILLAGAAALACLPGYAPAQTAPGQGQVNGQGYNHSNGPSVTTGQPMQDCEELIASGDGSDPGHSANSGNSAFGGSAGDVYAGSQPQNSRNSASVSQYDVACLHGTQGQ
jgi:hypothetical protein